MKTQPWTRKTKLICNICSFILVCLTKMKIKQSWSWHEGKLFLLGPVSVCMISYNAECVESLQTLSLQISVHTHLPLTSLLSCLQEMLNCGTQFHPYSEEFSIWCTANLAQPLKPFFLQILEQPGLSFSLGDTWVMLLHSFLDLKFPQVQRYLAQGFACGLILMLVIFHPLFLTCFLWGLESLLPFLQVTEYWTSCVVAVFMLADRVC